MVPPHPNVSVFQNGLFDFFCEFLDEVAMLDNEVVLFARIVAKLIQPMRPSSKNSMSLQSPDRIEEPAVPLWFL
ncbi:hypothetical protein J3R74_000606 [Puniceicoccus vermicola]|nr:hypothetical protein [Puniceicoccus vermicola]